MASEEAPEAAGTRRGWLDALGLSRPELRAWALYDWANSAMVTTIITAVFPIYFSKAACSGLPQGEATKRLALATTIGMVVIAVLAPILGTVADTRPVKKRFLGGFLGLGLVAVAAMFFIYEGDWLLASVLFIVANIGANGSFVFYDSLLPHVAREDEVDRVSTAGYALGYVGGGLLLILNLAWIMKPEWFGLPSGPNLTPAERTLPSRLAFVSVAVWWGVFSIPLFRRVSEPPVRLESGEKRGGNPVVAAFGRLAETFRHLRRYRQGLLMLLAFLIYNDGIGTVIRMATSYGEELKIEQSWMIGSIIVVQFVGIPCAFGFGLLAEKFRAKTLILAGLCVYVGISVLGFFMSTGYHFLLLAGMVGVVQGGSQALSRSLFASLIPRERSGEFFGFFAVVEKFAGIAGPFLFYVAIEAVGSIRASILTVIPFFVVGGALLLMVDVEKGRKEAREVEGEAVSPSSEG